MARICHHCADLTGEAVIAQVETDVAVHFTRDRSARRSSANRNWGAVAIPHRVVQVVIDAVDEVGGRLARMHHPVARQFGPSLEYVPFQCALTDVLARLIDQQRGLAHHQGDRPKRVGGAFLALTARQRKALREIKLVVAAHREMERHCARFNRVAGELPGGGDRLQIGRGLGRLRSRIG